MTAYADLAALAEWTSTKLAALPPDRATLCLSAASRIVDDLAGRSFDVAPAAATQRRVYVTGGRHILSIADFVGDAEIRIGSATGDVVPDDKYATWPDTAPYETPEEPYTGLVRLDGAPWFFGLQGNGYWAAPHLRRRMVTERKCPVWITTRWGWPTEYPDVVVQATLFAAAKMLRLKDLPLGMIENPELGTIHMVRGTDPSIKMLLKTVKRRPIVGGGRR